MFLNLEMTLITLHMKQDKKKHWSSFCNRLIDFCNHWDIAMFHIVEYLVSLIFVIRDESYSYSMAHTIWALLMLDLRPSKFRTIFILNEFQIEIPFFFHFKIFTREIHDLSCKLGSIVWQSLGPWPLLALSSTGLRFLQCHGKYVPDKLSSCCIFIGSKFGAKTFRDLET